MQSIAPISSISSASSFMRDGAVEFGRGVLDTAMPTAAFAATGLVMTVIPVSHVSQIPIDIVSSLTAATFAPLAAGTACMKAEEAKPVKANTVMRNLGRALPVLAAVASAVVAFNLVSPSAASTETVASNTPAKPVQHTLQ